MSQATIQLTGSYSLTPPSSPASSAQTIGSPIQQVNYVSNQAALSFDLTSDSITSLTFPPGMTNCHFFYLAVQGGSPVKVTVTSSYGSSQIIPCDPLVILYQNSLPITAISVQRTAGVLTTLTYLIAQNT